MITDLTLSWCLYRGNVSLQVCRRNVYNGEAIVMCVSRLLVFISNKTSLLIGYSVMIRNHRRSQQL